MEEMIIELIKLYGLSVGIPIVITVGLIMLYVYSNVELKEGEEDDGYNLSADDEDEDDSLEP